MDIAVIGTGYVGITTAASLGELGHHIIAVDIDEHKINELNKGILPIYEPGVEQVIRTLLEQGTLQFTTSMKEAVEGSEILLIAVGTPSLSDGSPNMKFVEEVAAVMGAYMTTYKVIINKSTVPIGTADYVKSMITEQLMLRDLNVDCDVVSNPEFLQEGKALQDARKPDRIVIGSSSPRAVELMLKMYEKVDAPKLITTPQNAEMIKYASNGFLATKISFINELARLCDRLSVDVVEVAKGIGLDRRIGPHFLQAGIGYGGSCFPKDIDALVNMGREVNLDMTILRSVQAVNRTQTGWLIDTIKAAMGGLEGKRITMLGLAFKPDTDDIREAPSLRLIPVLLDEGAIINGYDPVANHRIGEVFPDMDLMVDAYQAVEEADAIVICTEWKEIINLDWRKIRGSMKGDFIFDGRNTLDGIMLRNEGFQYWGVGRKLNADKLQYEKN